MRFRILPILLHSCTVPKTWSSYSRCCCQMNLTPTYMAASPVLVCWEVPSLQGYGVNVETRQKLVGNWWISCLMCCVSHSRNASVFRTQSLCSPVRAQRFTISYCAFKTKIGACGSASIIRALPWVNSHLWWPWLARCLVKVATSETGHWEAGNPKVLLFASTLLKNKPLHFHGTTQCQCQKFRLGVRDWFPFQWSLLPVLQVVFPGEPRCRQAHWRQQSACSRVDLFANQEKKKTSKTSLCRFNLTSRSVKCAVL